MSKNMPARLKTLTCSLTLALAVTTTQADEREDMETLRQTTLNLIQLLVQQGVLTQDKADLLIKQAESKAKETVATQKKTAAGVVRVPYVPESVKMQIADQIREEVIAQAKTERWGDINAVPEWVDRLKLDGDVRVRFQSDRFGDGNPTPLQFLATEGQVINNTSEDRNRLRLRARLGLNAKVTPAISAGLRLATGNLQDPVSTNQTLGQYGNKYDFVLDRAFLKVHSDETLPWLTASAGRIPNPWFGTDLVWDDDLNFEGAALHIDPNAQSARTWRPFLTLGAFPLQEIEQSDTVQAKSKWLFGAQGGVEWVRDANARAKLGLAYYNYRNISGIRNDFGLDTYNRTAPQFRQKGNTVFQINPPANDLYALAADYRLLNLTGMVDLNLYDPVHVILTADYVKNIGFSRSKTFARTGFDLDPQTKGYMARVAVGMPTMLLKNDWQVFLAYRHLEADAVLDAFTDSDFHLGGTNNKGFIIGGQYGLAKDTWIGARWLSSNQITGLPLSIDVFQLDLNVKF